MPGKAIEQFIWGYQQHFRRSVEMATRSLLEAIGCGGEAEVYLIGFALSDAVRHPVCVEPEDGPFRPGQLAGIGDRSSALYAQNPESQMRYSVPHVHDERHDALRDESRGLAIREVLENDHPTGGITFFVSRSAAVGEYAVHVAVGLPDAVVAAVPALTTTVKDRITITTSLLAGALAELLRAATRALYVPNAGSELWAVDRTAAELARSAARNLARSVMVLAGNEMGDSPFEPLNEISTLRYERRAGFGRMLMARPATPGVSTTISLRRRVPLAQHRNVRKLLELAGMERLSLLTDGTEVYGLGAFSGEPVEPESTFEIRIMGQGAWELLCDGRALISVQYGAPKLPRPRLERDRFQDLAVRILGSSETCDPAKLWDLAEAAAHAEHGTMLVVTPAARAEADRLGSQAILIEPTPLSSDVLTELTAIDGAVLLEPDGTGIAIGVILDGTASAAGDPSRGARFNSALRYLHSATNPTFIILVSEDGMINLLPDLRMRISRKSLQQNLDDLRAVAAKPKYDPERFHRAYDRLKDLTFYLSGDECAEVNRLREEMEDRRWKESSMRLTMPDLRPDPEMNDSYLLD
jgi:hypothetical protein